MLCRERTWRAFPRRGRGHFKPPPTRPAAARRPDLSVRELRGNVATRLQKLHDGLYDAIVLARARRARAPVDIRTPNTTPLPFLPRPARNHRPRSAPERRALPDG